jgi:integrase
VQTVTEPGLYGDGGNLWLKVSAAGTRSWVFRYTIAGRPRSMGLGSTRDVSLAEARNKANEARKLVREGTDPIDARQTARGAAAAVQAHTFSHVMNQYLAAHAPAWRNDRHRTIWIASMANHVLPLIGQMAVAAIDTAQVMRVLIPLWHKTPETASRIRGRVESVLAYAIAHGWRDGPNPALWRGHIQQLLPARDKLRPVVHFAALDWQEAPAFMAALRRRNSLSARALEFLILTVARSGELRGATWDEVDMTRAVWTIPATRMKGGKSHRVPLSETALALLETMAPMRSAKRLIFPGRSLRRPMNMSTMNDLLDRMGYGHVTTHGARSTFRDWAAEATGYPNHVVEQALAHVIGNQVEAAYRRGDLFEKRRVLMNDWAAFLERPAAAVVPLSAAR